MPDLYCRRCDYLQVKFSVEVPASIIDECYRLTLQEYGQRYQVSFLCEELHQMKLLNNSDPCG
jgi:hypothetical protein